MCKNMSYSKNHIDESINILKSIDYNIIDNMAEIISNNLGFRKNQTPK